MKWKSEPHRRRAQNPKDREGKRCKLCSAGALQRSSECYLLGARDCFWSLLSYLLEERRWKKKEQDRDNNEPTICCFQAQAVCIQSLFRLVPLLPSRSLCVCLLILSVAPVLVSRDYLYIIGARILRHARKKRYKTQRNAVRKEKERLTAASLNKKEKEISSGQLYKTRDRGMTSYPEIIRFLFTAGQRSLLGRALTYRTRWLMNSYKHLVLVLFS